MIFVLYVTQKHIINQLILNIFFKFLAILTCITHSKTQARAIEIKAPKKLSNNKINILTNFELNDMGI